MKYGAIDLHKEGKPDSVMMEGGAIVDRRIATTRDRLTAVFRGRLRMRILLEATTFNSHNRRMSSFEQRLSTREA